MKRKKKIDKYTEGCMFENMTMAAALDGRLAFRSHVLNMNFKNPYRTEFAAGIQTDGKEDVNG